MAESWYRKDHTQAMNRGLGVHQIMQKDDIFGSENKNGDTNLICKRRVLSLSNKDRFTRGQVI